MEWQFRKIVCETFVGIIWHKKGACPAWLNGWQPFDILQSSLGSLDRGGTKDGRGCNSSANYTHNTHHYIMLESAPLAFDVSKLLATFANVMPKKLHLQLKVIQAQATAGAEPSSCRNENGPSRIIWNYWAWAIYSKTMAKNFFGQRENVHAMCVALFHFHTDSLTLSLSVIRWQSCVIKKEVFCVTLATLQLRCFCGHVVCCLQFPILFCI